MATTTTMKGHFIKVGPFAVNTDWTLANDLPDYQNTGLKVKSITFIASGANDIMIIHEDGVDGPEIFKADAEDFTAAGESVRYEYGNGTWMFPVIDYSDCTIAASSNAVVVFEIA